VTAAVTVLERGYLEKIESWGSDERIVEAARMSTGKGFLGQVHLARRKEGRRARRPAESAVVPQPRNQTLRERTGRMTYDRVWRLLDANRGRLCRIVTFAPVLFDALGARQYHDNSEQVAVEFEDGTRVMASRSAAVLAASRTGRQTIWKVARGGARIRRKDVRDARALFPR
jgi:hypothetical protein